MKTLIVLLAMGLAVAAYDHTHAGDAVEKECVKSAWALNPCEGWGE